MERLLKAGFRVPQFVIVERVEDVVFEADSYAVRSNASSEDLSGSSMAGQFLTLLDLPAADLRWAISEVMARGSESVIVQEFIEPEYAGILFTRSPLGGREMVIEYHRGIGEEVVSGKVLPLREEFYFEEKREFGLPFLAELREAGRRIEQLFGFPQDIEWCFAKGELYFLQARAITSLSTEQFEAMKFLERELPKDQDFFYKKTAICEVAPRPCRETLDLLQAIYREGGPVDSVYERHGMKYEERDFLRVVGGELFVDMEEEARTLYPAYGYLNRRYEFKLMHFGGFWRSLVNGWRLGRISLHEYEDLRAKVKRGLGRKLDQGLGLEARREFFLEEYRVIFEVNLLAELAFRRLSKLLSREKVAVAEILAGNFEREFEGVMHFEAKGLKGNGLDLADLSEFVMVDSRHELSEGVKDWYANLSEHKRHRLIPYCVQAQRFVALRENARWLTVRLVNYLREVMEVSAVAGGMSLPAVLRGRFVEEERKVMLVSPGEAIGVLHEEAEISKGDILYVSDLRPDLTKYFGVVNGIVAENGGMLSHLAIMAREAGLAVLVGVGRRELEEMGVRVGDKVQVRSDKLEIK